MGQASEVGTFISVEEQLEAIMASLGDAFVPDSLRKFVALAGINDELEIRQLSGVDELAEEESVYILHYAPKGRRGLACVGVYVGEGVDGARLAVFDVLWQQSDLLHRGMADDRFLEEMRACLDTGEGSSELLALEGVEVGRTGFSLRFKAEIEANGEFGDNFEVHKVALGESGFKLGRGGLEWAGGEGRAAVLRTEVVKEG